MLWMPYIQNPSVRTHKKARSGGMTIVRHAPAAHYLKIERIRTGGAGSDLRRMIQADNEPVLGGTWQTSINI